MPAAAGPPHYAAGMEPPAPGDLITVAAGERRLDGIVAERPSPAKAIVAVIDRRRGPVLRSMDARTLSAREEAGADDRALRLLIRRTPRAGGRSGRGGADAGSDRAAHARTAKHRTTGK